MPAGPPFVALRGGPTGEEGATDGAGDTGRGAASSAAECIRRRCECIRSSALWLGASSALAAVVAGDNSTAAAAGCCCSTGATAAASAASA